MYCNLCPRMCNRQRSSNQLGFCGQTEEIRVARAALHFWEEPCISGKNGSGAVFFCGCNLGCIYCQNYEIAHGRTARPDACGNVEKQQGMRLGTSYGQPEAGQPVSRERLAEIFLELQEKNAHNINLVTASHFVPMLVPALQLAKSQGLQIPIVYNSSAYEKTDTLKQLEGLVDIYLPDFKYMEEEKAKNYSFAPDYPMVAKEAIREMFRQVGKNEFEGDCMSRGMIIRHMVLPLGVKNAQQVISYLWETYGNDIYLSIMKQYTPPMEISRNQAQPAGKQIVGNQAQPAGKQIAGNQAQPAGQQIAGNQAQPTGKQIVGRRILPYPELNRKVTKREYERVVDYALSLGITNAFFQEGDVAKESFIPCFDGEGV
ncbi:MAG: radical SAM protein [Lachnospiraceae bacterium]